MSRGRALGDPRPLLVPGQCRGRSTASTAPQPATHRCSRRGPAPADHHHAAHPQRSPGPPVRAATSFRGFGAEGQTVVRRQHRCRAPSRRAARVRVLPVGPPGTERVWPQDQEGPGRIGHRDLGGDHIVSAQVAVPNLWLHRPVEAGSQAEGPIAWLDGARRGGGLAHPYPIPLPQRRSECPVGPNGGWVGGAEKGSAGPPTNKPMVSVGTFASPRSCTAMRRAGTSTTT